MNEENKTETKELHQYQYTVTYTLNKVQDDRIKKWAKHNHMSPEDVFRFVMLLGAQEEIEEKLNRCQI